jgi:cysteine-rich repeat protein
MNPRRVGLLLVVLVLCTGILATGVLAFSFADFFKNLFTQNVAGEAATQQPLPCSPDDPTCGGCVPGDPGCGPAEPLDCGLGTFCQGKTEGWYGYNTCQDAYCDGTGGCLEKRNTGPFCNGACCGWGGEGNWTCQNNVCVNQDYLTDVNNCGGLGNKCQTTCYSNATCVNGQCQYECWAGNINGQCINDVSCSNIASDSCVVNTNKPRDTACSKDGFDGLCDGNGHCVPPDACGLHGQPACLQNTNNPASITQCNSYCKSQSLPNGQGGVATYQLQRCADGRCWINCAAGEQNQVLDGEYGCNTCKGVSNVRYNGGGTEGGYPQAGSDWTIRTSMDNPESICCNTQTQCVGWAVGGIQSPSSCYNQGIIQGRTSSGGPVDHWICAVAPRQTAPAFYSCSASHSGEIFGGTYCCRLNITQNRYQFTTDLSACSSTPTCTVEGQSCRTTTGAGTYSCNANGDPVCEQTCNDACSPGATQCQGKLVQTCNLAANNCYAWSVASTCSGNQVCSNNVCGAPTCVAPAFCSATQPTGAQPTNGLCAGNNNCYQCPANQILQNGACVTPPCTALTCANYTGACGTSLSNGCGATINCGCTNSVCNTTTPGQVGICTTTCNPACPAGQACNNGVCQSTCPATQCTPNAIMCALVTTGVPVNLVFNAPQTVSTNSGTYTVHWNRIDLSSAPTLHTYYINVTRNGVTRTLIMQSGQSINQPLINATFTFNTTGTLSGVMLFIQPLYSIANFRVCTLNASGCFSFGAPIACPAGQSCDQNACISACVNNDGICTAGCTLFTDNDCPLPPQCTDVDADGFSLVPTATNSTGGQVSCGPVDCNDNNGTIHPGAPELCNLVDDDCDGQIDEGCSVLCQDTDGQDPNVTGRVNISINGVTAQVYVDACVGSQVNESFCGNATSVNFTLINCPNGCLNGACIPTTCINNNGVCGVGCTNLTDSDCNVFNCADNDTGIFPAVFGQANMTMNGVLIDVQMDMCFSSIQVREVYCNTTRINTTIISCANGCLNGVCVGGNAPQCSDGVDNDGDGLVDFPLDLGCASPVDTNESDNSDFDQDGCADAVDRFPTIWSPDSDGDGRSDDCDNCITIPNPAQTDANGNGIGDACEVVGICGNGLIEPGEQCDGANRSITSCSGFDRFTGGVLSCTSRCLYNTTLCTGTSGGTCGDGIIQVGEQCDGNNWTPITGCSNFSFTSGVLSCSPQCIFNTTLCLLSPPPTCTDSDGMNTTNRGNITISPPPAVLYDSCSNGTAPVASCTGPTCFLTEYACNGATPNSTNYTCNSCGNGICAGNCSATQNSCAVPGGFLCVNRCTGAAACDNDACNGCSANAPSCGGTCGNGVIEPGEQCDGGNWGTITSCSAFDNYTGGVLSCNTATCQFNVSQCTGGNASGICGDGVINAGEQCDTTAFGPVTGCTRFDNFTGGSLSCNTCIFNTTACFRQVCGDGVVQPGEQCDAGTANGACPAGCSASCTTNTNCGGGGGGGGGGRYHYVPPVLDHGRNSNSTPNGCPTGYREVAGRCIKIDLVPAPNTNATITGTLQMIYESTLYVVPAGIVEYEVTVIGTGDEGSQGVSVELALPADWDYSGPVALGNIPKGEKRVAKFKLVTGCRTLAESVVGIRASSANNGKVEDDVRAIADLPFFLVKPRPSLTAYGESDLIPVCEIVYNSGSTQRKDLEIELDVNEGTHTLAVDYFSTFNLDPGAQKVRIYNVPAKQVLGRDAVAMGYLKERGKVIETSSNEMP